MNNVLDIAAKVQMAAQMYSARDSIQSILGREAFMARVEDFRPKYARVCELAKLSQIQAVIALMKEAAGDGYKQLMLLAMCVEIMEPSAPPTTQSDGG